MADYIFIRKSRNILSSVLHVVFNILLGVGSIFITIVSGSFIIGCFLVLVSKWRMFMVHPRYWFFNFKSNLVDLIVGFSFILLAYLIGTTLAPAHLLLTVAYVAWLIFIKPRSSAEATILQALVAVFLGGSVAALIAATVNPIVICFLCFIVGYGASRHVIIQSGDREYSLIVLTYGLFFAEIAWLSHAWLIIYTFGDTGIRIPQLAIILTILSFAFNRIYQSILRNDGALKGSDVALPIIFSVLTIFIIIFGFSQPIFNV